MAQKGGLKPASVSGVNTSRKRRASQSIAPTSTSEPRTVALRLGNKVVFDNQVCSWQLVGKGDCKLISMWDDRSESQTDEESAVSAVVLAPGIGRGTPAFSAIPNALQGFAIAAPKIVINYTLYGYPLLTPVEVLLLVQSLWDRVQTEERHGERVKEVDGYLGYQIP